MAHDVSRLKELLFESESRTLSDLSRRMDAVFERAGSRERFTASVASVLDTALRQAEVEHHAEVAQAIAPLIVKTIKTEIRGSQDELAEALYPSMGRMVRSYVVSAFRDLTDEINRRFEANRFMLRVRSLLTGRPIAELALAAGRRQEVEEIYLIRRGSGELVGHWPQSKSEGDASLREHTRSGILAAINDVTTEAFLAEEGALRRIDLESALVYLRASPAHLLAVKCSGTAPPAMEQEIDEQFIATIERLHSQTNGATPEGTGSLLAGLASRLDATFAEQHARRVGRHGGVTPAVILLWGCMLLLAAWAAWGGYTSYLTARTRSIAETIINGDPALRGYPVHVDVDAHGRRLALLGLVPTPATATATIERLRSALPGAQIADRTSALPGDLDEARAHIDKLQASLDRLAADTARADAETRKMASLDAEQKRAEIERVGGELARQHSDTQASLEALRAELARLSQTTPRQQLEQWARTHAIFFDKDTDYRDAKASTAALDELAGLIKQSDALVRVVGHTDEKGGLEHNSPLSLARASKVVAELTARGVPAGWLVAVGRNDVANLSPATGDASPNRRVEFEIGFEGEQKP